MLDPEVPLDGVVSGGGGGGGVGGGGGGGGKRAEVTPLLKRRRKAKLTWRTKLLYGMGGLGYYGGNLLVGFFFQTYLLEVARLDPIYVGLVLLFGQVTDIITTPLIGKISDNFTSSFGRRRPFMFAAAIPYSILYFLSWNVFFSEQVSLFTYVSVMFVLWNSLGNVISVPFNALAPDLSDGYDEATELINVRIFMEISFGVIVAFVQSLLIELFHDPDTAEPDYRKGYFTATIVFGSVFLLFPMISSFFLKERQRSAKEMADDTQNGLMDNIKDLIATFKSRNYVMLMITYLCIWTAIALIQNNLFLLVKYALDRESMFLYLIAEVQVMAAVFAVVWSQVTKVAGKRWTFVIGTSQLILVLIAFFFLDETTPVWILFICAGVAGASLSVGMLIPYTMLPDIIDEDEYVNYVRREGSFYSLIVLLQKIGLATALASSSWILGASGYLAPEPNDPNPDSQPPSAVQALKIICGPVAISLVLLSIIPMFFYRLDKKRVQEYQSKLVERKMALTANPENSNDNVGIFNIDEVWS